MSSSSEAKDPPPALTTGDVMKTSRSAPTSSCRGNPVPTVGRGGGHAQHVQPQTDRRHPTFITSCGHNKAMVILEPPICHPRAKRRIPRPHSQPAPPTRRTAPPLLVFPDSDRGPTGGAGDCSDTSFHITSSRLPREPAGQLHIASTKWKPHPLCSRISR